MIKYRTRGFGKLRKYLSYYVAYMKLDDFASGDELMQFIYSGLFKRKCLLKEIKNKTKTSSIGKCSGKT